MISNKRGAVELSITTIVVVVIGITLLTLGLIWVTNIFDRLGGTTGSAFDQVDAQIGEIFGQVDDAITLSPPTIKLKKGELKTVTLILANIGENPLNGVKAVYDGTNSDLNAKLDCLFADTGGGTSSQSYNLGSDQQAKITMYVKDRGAPLGINTCTVTVDKFETAGLSFTRSLVIERVS